MRRLVLILVLLVLAGCQPYCSKVQVIDPNSGQVVKEWRLESNRPAQIRVVDGDTEIEGDTRTVGILESLSLTFGLGREVSGYE